MRSVWPIEPVHDRAYCSCCLIGWRIFARACLSASHNVPARSPRPCFKLLGVKRALEDRIDVKFPGNHRICRRFAARAKFETSSSCGKSGGLRSDYVRSFKTRPLYGRLLVLAMCKAIAQCERLFQSQAASAKSSQTSDFDSAFDQCRRRLLFQDRPRSRRSCTKRRDLAPIKTTNNLCFL